ncbi:MAG TPA: ABC transporter substrate-binding protein [Alphaproteobacteria bacterium]|nr:ABC transporter substrate-binding protein [Alphaproteobacteria bacterium]
MIRRFALGAAFCALTLAAGPVQAQETLQVWFTKAFYPAEDKALQDVIKSFEQRTGVKIDLSLFSPEDVVTKSVAAVEAGTPPDVGFGLTYDFRVTGKWAYEGKLEDISDVIEPLKGQFSEGPLSTTLLFNSKANKRAYYAAPVEMQLMHINYWIDMLQDAGFKESDIPQGWSDFWNFWCDKVQGALRAKGKRVFGIGHPASVQASDTFYSFHMFMNAYNVQVVDNDGKLTLDQPANKAGFANAIRDYANIVARGCSPASAVNWGDADNNINFANKTTVLTHNATISIAAAQFDAMNKADATEEQKAQSRKNYYELIRTRGFPDKPGGGKLPQLAAVKTAVIFADARNKKRAKEFLAFFLAEQNLQTYVEGSLGRWIPITKKAVDAPFWTDGKDPHRAAVNKQVQEGIVFFPFTKNWRFTIVNAENVWGRAVTRVAKDGVAPDKAADEAVERIKQILASN